MSWALVVCNYVLIVLYVKKRNAVKEYVCYSERFQWKCCQKWYFDIKLHRP